MLENPLLPLHEQAEALFLPFGPDIQIVESYGTPEIEYAAIRKSTALMDCPHRSIVELTGQDRLPFLNNLITNDAKVLTPGQGCYAYMLNTKGRIVLDMYVLELPERTLLDVDSRLAEGLCRTLENYIFGEDVKVAEGRGRWARLSLIGPTAAAVLQELGASEVAGLANLQIRPGTVAGVEGFIFRNDLCGLSQYEIVAPRNQMGALWTALHSLDGPPPASVPERAAPRRVRSIGWSAFNIARIESATLFFGIDITEQNLPMETAHWYRRAVSLKKGCYLGQEVVARMHSHRSVARMFVGMKVQGALPPVAGEELRADDTAVGMVTSSCISPMLGQVPIAMGYVKNQIAQDGRQLQAYAPDGPTSVTLRPMPFWGSTPPPPAP